MRLLVRLRPDADVFVIVVFARKRKGLLGPGAPDYLEHFGKAFGALAVGDPVSFIGPREAAAPDAEEQPAMADVVNRRGLFRQSERLTERQNLDAETNLDLLCPRRDGAGDRQRRRADRAFGRHMDFG